MIGAKLPLHEEHPVADAPSQLAARASTHGGVEYEPVVRHLGAETGEALLNAILSDRFIRSLANGSHIKLLKERQVTNRNQDLARSWFQGRREPRRRVVVKHVAVVHFHDAFLHYVGCRALPETAAIPTYPRRVDIDSDVRGNGFWKLEVGLTICVRL